MRQGDELLRFSGLRTANAASPSEFSVSRFGNVRKVDRFSRSMLSVLSRSRGVR
jgi:hypothetical protein